MNKQKNKPSDREVIEKLSQITGEQLCWLIKKLGITGKKYGMMVEPPLQTASGVWNYARKGSIPFRMIKPMIENYDPHFLLALLKQKWVIE